MRSSRGFGLLLSALALAALPGPVRAAGPTKPEVTRKAFDYRHPESGEMLANPLAGVGTEPQLREYAPTASMNDATGPTPQGNTNITSSSAATPASVPEVALSPQSAPPPPAQQARKQDTAPAASPAASMPSPAQDPRSALRARFATEIVRSGIDGISPDLPAEVASSEQLALLKSTWAALAGSLQASSQAWATQSPSRTPAALDRVETITGPGQVTIVAAPGRLTGASEATVP